MIDVNRTGLTGGLYAVLVRAEGELYWQETRDYQYGCYTARYQPDYYFTPRKGEQPNWYQMSKPVMLTADGEPMNWVRQRKVRWHYEGGPHDRKQLPLPRVIILPEQQPYFAQQMISGSSHSDCLPELWISDPEQPLPAWVQLSWDAPQTIGELRIVFDTDLDMPQPSPTPVENLSKRYAMPA